MMRHFLLLLVVVTLVGAPAHVSAAPNQTPPDPGLPGPYATDQFNFTLGATGATVFYPGANGVVAAGAGGGRRRSLLVGMLRKPNRFDRYRSCS